MLRSSHGFARRFIQGITSTSGTKSLSTTNAVLQKTSRRISQQPLTLLAVAGTALATGFCGRTINCGDDSVDHFFYHSEPLHNAMTTTIARATAAASAGLPITTHCEANQAVQKRETRLNRKKTTRYYDSSQDFAECEAKLKRKKTVLKMAASLERSGTKQEVASAALPITTHCDDDQAVQKRETRLNRKKTTRYYDPSQDFAKREAKLKRKKTVLKVAASLERLNTKQQVSRLRPMKSEMLTRWELDEDGWRELPSRAWPEFQPNPKQLENIRLEIEHLRCINKVLAKKKVDGNQTTLDNNSPEVSQCTTLLFHMATSLVFYQIDNEAGLALYERLAKRGHADSMVACGIVLVEGLGVTPREHDGLAWLEKAMEVQGADSSSMSAAQASYELGTIYYTGIDGVVDEDPEKAFELFQRAAKYDHTSALYMVADCLAEGEGVERNIARAVPLFYKAAERGHRYSRQRIRELLTHGGYPL